LFGTKDQTKILYGSHVILKLISK